MQSGEGGKLAIWTRLEFSEVRHWNSFDCFEPYTLDEDNYEEIFMIYLRIFAASITARNRKRTLSC